MFFLKNRKEGNVQNQKEWTPSNLLDDDVGAGGVELEYVGEQVYHLLVDDVGAGAVELEYVGEQVHTLPWLGS